MSALYALIHEQTVYALSPDEDAWPKDLFDVRDVSEVSGIQAGWLVAGDGTYSPPTVEPAPVAPTITYKADLFRRCSDVEAEMIDTALSTASVRERRLFDMAQYLDHSAPEFANMQSALTGMFGADRAAELLAAS